MIFKKAIITEQTKYLFIGHGKMNAQNYFAITLQSSVNTYKIAMHKM